MVWNSWSFRPLKHPVKAHPLVKLLVQKMNHQGVTVTEMCREAGIGRRTFSNWNSRNAPTLLQIEACFNALGYNLTAIPSEPDTLYKRVGRNVKEYRVVDSNGNEHSVLNMREFCTQNGLDAFEMYRIANTNKSHHGYRVFK